MYQAVDEDFVQFLNTTSCSEFCDFFIDDIGIDKISDFQLCTNEIWKTIRTRINKPITIAKLHFGLVSILNNIS